MAADAQIDVELGTLPLDAWHRARGARMVPFAGYAMPIQYGGIVAEHEWTRNHAGLFDVSHMGQLFVSGAEAEAALEALLPIDVAVLEAARHPGASIEPVDAENAPTTQGRGGFVLLRRRRRQAETETVRVLSSCTITSSRFGAPPPSVSQAWHVPSVGCPAKGSSSTGVKMRTR